jgi:tetratricopeptide (TPR) repeat protein
MKPLDVNALMARAELSFRNRRHDAAKADLSTLIGIVGEHPAVLHLLALVEQQAGNTSAALAVFSRALMQSPLDPQINNNFANLLDAEGALDQAVVHYSKALSQVPNFWKARRNRATTLQKLGMFDMALLDLDQVIAANPADLDAYEARGGVHKAAGNSTAAGADFSHVVALSPSRPMAMHGLARLATERNEDDAFELYRSAHAISPRDLDVTLGYAEAIEAVGRSGAIELLEAAVDANPGWIAGHDSLARMRSEAGEFDSFAKNYAGAIARRPSDRALHLAYWSCLARGGEHAEALAALEAARPMLGSDPEIDLFEAVLASETGDTERAEMVFGRLDKSPEVELARGRNALRKGDPAYASAILEPLARDDLDAVIVWAHLSIAWRLTKDPRGAWLCEQPGLCGAQDLPMDAAAIDQLAEVLRGLHRTRSHPIGQSLRGGTQTRGRLFNRKESAIGRLETLLAKSVASHVANLPPLDVTHPLLRHRNTPLKFGGNWSVRLSSGGFHVNHVHPQGILSSACYVALPDMTGTTKEGWLELGSPPAELNIDLPPLATIEPSPGRLVLFPSYLYHGTRPFSDGERLTVAFDVETSAG